MNNPERLADGRTCAAFLNDIAKCYEKNDYKNEIFKIGRGNQAMTNQYNYIKNKYNAHKYDNWRLSIFIVRNNLLDNPDFCDEFGISDWKQRIY